MNQELKWVVDVLQDAADALRNSHPSHLNQQTSQHHCKVYVAVNEAIGRLDPDSYQAKAMNYVPVPRN